jgi:hypothetical protein
MNYPKMVLAMALIDVAQSPQCPSAPKKHYQTCREKELLGMPTNSLLKGQK